MTFYQNISAHYAHIFPFNSNQLNFISTQASIEDHPQLLEIGSATGLLADACYTKGYKVKGLELDESMVNIAEEDFPNIPFLCENMLNISQHFESTSQDLIICFGNTLVHLNSLVLMQSFLDSAYGILKKGGKLLVQFINYDRIIDQNITSLPPIDNEYISFDRSYQLVSRTQLSFRGNLTIKSSGQSSFSTQMLFPLRKSDFEVMAHKAGFTTQVFGTFKGDVWTENTLQTIISCVK